MIRLCICLVGLLCLPLTLAAKETIPSNTWLAGTTENAVKIDATDIRVQPLDIKISNKSKCHIFGFYVLQADKQPAVITGLVTRLACKKNGSFKVWNIKGDVKYKDAASLPYTKDGNIYSLKSGIPVSVNLTNQYVPRETKQIYLYKKDYVYKPILVNLSTLATFSKNNQGEPLPVILKEENTKVEY